MLGRKERENDAEHSWHAVMWFILLEPFLKTKINSEKVVKMLIMHDLPEIYAGDVLTFHKNNSHREKEIKGAKKIFKQFPKNLSRKYFDLWYEFEHGKTKEAKVARAMDKLQPILQNINTQGKAWKWNHINYKTVDDHKRKHMEFDGAILKIYEALMKQAKQYIQ